jgi:hypothetical protein
MGNLGRRLLKLEAHQGGLSSAWLKRASIEELETRLRELVAKWKGCKPEEVDLTDDELNDLIAREGSSNEP